MKKLILVFVMILSINQFVNAQDDIKDSSNKLDIRFGAKAGLNLASLTGDVEGVKGRTSFHIGGIAELMINDEFAVQPELLYSAQGAKSGDLKINLDYINLPIMGKYFVSDEITLEAGPQLGYLLSAKLEFENPENGGITVTESSRNIKSNNAAAAETQDIKEDIKSIDFGFNLGGSYILENGINLSLRYYIGLANASNFQNDDGTFKNSVFQLSIGYFFN